MQSGWVKLHRSILDWEWYDDINTFRLFIHCLLRANHADKEWRGKLIKRGSFFTSLESLSAETGLTVRQIRTSLDKLGQTSEVTSSGQARGRMITVLNYDKYQSDDKLDGSQMTGKGQADDRLMTTNKNVRRKEGKNTTSAKPKYEAKDVEFAQKAFEEIRKHTPDYKKPNLKLWARDVCLMRERDNRDLEEMARIWVWCHKDNFEQGNVLSIGKFRKRYDQLKIKATKGNGGVNGEANKRSDSSAYGRVKAASQRELEQLEREISEEEAQSQHTAALESDDWPVRT